ncbi:hypothetical protein EVAR_4296_1 [Eumeta japonica]|uniref:Uncharacterized protein n=1 Tax=Eumeta variegata TaxID=151549 RepID=A0A4C1VCY8_EUMVA|nr:hypothetical protein EVAR_4296_1 [Eumeta japonica]
MQIHHPVALAVIYPWFLRLNFLMINLKQNRSTLVVLPQDILAIPKAKHHPNGEGKHQSKCNYIITLRKDSDSIKKILAKRGRGGPKDEE